MIKKGHSIPGHPPPRIRIVRQRPNEIDKSPEMSTCHLHQMSHPFKLPSIQLCLILFLLFSFTFLDVRRLRHNSPAYLFSLQINIGVN